MSDPFETSILCGLSGSLVSDRSQGPSFRPFGNSVDTDPEIDVPVPWGSHRIDPSNIPPPPGQISDPPTPSN
jgi:hypothetical protein